MIKHAFVIYKVVTETSWPTAIHVPQLVYYKPVEAAKAM